MVNIFTGAWFLFVGAVGLLRPTFFFRSEKLTPEQITRNTRIWRWGGLGLILAGTAILAIEFLSK
jgi:multisubunit Na+/H+ antiporter MnhG subunit